MSQHLIDRRSFNVAWAYALLGGAAITVGCGSETPTGSGGDSGSGGGGGGGATVTDKEGQVSNNHGHRAIITAAQLTAGNGLELNIQDTGTHGHTITLAAADVVAVRGGTRVSVTSSTTNGHTHTVTFN
jgi:hypothetical protein